MYQWWMAQEQADLWNEENRPLTSAERQRLEVMEEFEDSKPSFFRRFASLFRADAPSVEHFMPRSREEAELVAIGAFEETERRS